MQAILKTWTLSTVLMLRLGLAVSPSAEASKKEGKSKAVTIKTHKQSTGSGETRAERDRRLTRECRGRPNAGACLGYAS